MGWGRRRGVALGLGPRHGAGSPSPGGLAAGRRRVQEAAGARSGGDAQGGAPGEERPGGGCAPREERPGGGGAPGKERPGDGGHQRRAAAQASPVPFAKERDAFDASGRDECAEERERHRPIPFVPASLPLYVCELGRTALLTEASSGGRHGSGRRARPRRGGSGKRERPQRRGSRQSSGVNSVGDRDKLAPADRYCVDWRLKKKLTCRAHTLASGGREKQQGYFGTYENTVAFSDLQVGQRC